MRWKNRPLFIFAKIPRYAKHQSPIAYLRDLKKRWGEGGDRLLHRLGVSAMGWRNLVSFQGAPGEKAKLLSCRTL